MLFAWCFQTRVHSVLKQQKTKPAPQPPELENAERFVFCIRKQSYENTRADWLKVVFL